VARLLAVLYTLSPSIKEFKMAETSLSESQWASYFQQASIGTHLNHAFVTRVKRVEDKFTASNRDFVESSLPTTASHCLQLPPQRVKDLEEFIHGFYRSLPEIIIVCMNFLEADMEKLVGEHLEKSETNTWIMISRIYMDHMPICIVLPIRGTLEKQYPDPSVNPWVCPWRGTVVDRVAPEFELIHWTKQEVFKTNALEGDKRWRTLDERVSRFLKGMQTRWMEPWQNLLLGERLNDADFNIEVVKFKNDLKDKCNLDIQESILKSMMECAYEHLEDLGFLAEAILAKGCYNGSQSIDGTELTWICKRLHEACTNTNKESRRKPIILVMDSDLQMLPWESMEVLRNEEAYRMPSVPSIVSTLSIRSYYERNFKDASLFPTIDPRRSFYLLNVGGDLDLDMLIEWFRNSNMKGIAKSEPSEDALREALTTNDLYIYLSHDSGEQYIDGSVVQELGKCAAALLLGCSSGALTLCGSLRYKGAPIHYLLGGSPSIFCNLWAMGSQDMESFAKNLVEDLVNAVTTEREHDGPVYLGSFLRKHRNNIELPYLWGSSTVCYGVPTSISSEAT
nr:hypothetical protein [Tanacetum cinerariifolium]